MLIGVCKLREDAAASAMRAAELKLRNEEEEERRLRRQLGEYREWRVAEEDRRYDAVIGTDTDKAGMEEFRAGLASLKEKEVSYEGAIIESQRRQVVLREALEETRKVYHAVDGILFAYFKRGLAQQPATIHYLESLLKGGA